MSTLDPLQGRSGGIGLLEQTRHYCKDLRGGLAAYPRYRDDGRGGFIFFVDPEKDFIFGKENMAACKYPRQVEFIEELPKSPIQKILRKQLRDLEPERRQEKEN